MRSIFFATLVTVAFARRGHGRKGHMWWGGAPECAHNCLSSVYHEDATITAWPGPGHFCTEDAAAPLSTCLEASCTETPTAWTSFSSLRESICSVYASCTEASDQVYTLTYSAPTRTGTPRWGGRWSTYTGDGTITVTGCPTDGFGYGLGFGGHRGWMPWRGDRPDDGFWGWGYGWSGYTTYETTMTETVTDENGDETETETVETVAQAVTDGTTTTSPLGTIATAESDDGGDGDGGDGDDGNANGNGNNAASGSEVKIVGVALAALLGVAAAL